MSGLHSLLKRPYLSFDDFLALVKTLPRPAYKFIRFIAHILTYPLERISSQPRAIRGAFDLPPFLCPPKH